MVDHKFASSPELSNAILQTIAYADIFDFPLKGSEIYRYLVGQRVSQQDVEQAIQANRLISYVQGFYMLPGREDLAATRRQRESLAKQLWPLALKWSRVISRIPFVRMVAVTGSLAMDNVEKGVDIDYLIVTEVGRLWLCRAQVLLAGRLAARQGVVICPNYLISIKHLEFQDRSLYTAHEIAQMVPLAGLNVYACIRERNAWVEDFLPNAGGAPTEPEFTLQRKAAALRRPAAEAILNAAPFTAIERWEMKRKTQKLT